MAIVREACKIISLTLNIRPNSPGGEAYRLRKEAHRRTCKEVDLEKAPVGVETHRYHSTDSEFPDQLLADL